MEFNLDTAKLAIFLLGLILFLVLEALFPSRPAGTGKTRRLGFHGAVAVLNTVTVRVFAFVPFLLWSVYVEEEGWGLARWLGLYGWQEILLSLIVLDAFDYAWHRANHRVTFLWRVHKAHHSDTELDVSTSLRFHPGELLLSFVAKAIWIALWGPTVVAWFVFEVMVSACAQFHHANFDFPDRLDRLMSAVIVTPRFHAAHHAVDRRYGNANFSTIFSVWDHLFGTYSRPAAGGATTARLSSIGLPEARELSSNWPAWLLEPVTSRNLNLD